MKRLPQVALIGSTFGLCWLAMMAVHESGHVLHAWLSGGRVAEVYLDPFDFSLTRVEPNPHPLFVAWGGAVWGSVLPLFGWLLSRRYFNRYEFLWAFFAGFCLLSNGLYLGVGAFFPSGDAADLLKHGNPSWMLVLFGMATVPVGFWFWHGLGPQFGLGNAGGRVDANAARVVTVAFLAVLAVEWIIWHVLLAGPQGS